MGWAALGAGIGATSSGIGSAISGLWSAKAARDQRKWQERMTRHAYRYTMEDMRAAGLNPLLAYSQGATHPGQGAMAHVPDMGAGMTGLGDTAIRGSKRDAEVDAIQADADLKRAGTTAASAAAYKSANEGHLAATNQKILENTRPHSEALRDFYSTNAGKKFAVRKEQSMPIWSAGGGLFNEGRDKVEFDLNSANEAATRAGRRVNQWLRSDSIWRSITGKKGKKR